MVTEVARPPRKLLRTRLIIAGGVLAVICVAVAVQRESQRRQLIHAIENAGGNVSGRRSFVARLQDGISNGRISDSQLLVDVSGSMDNQWIREHDWLRPLKINRLLVVTNQVHGSDLARLIDSHPLERLRISSAAVTEDVLSAIARKESLFSFEAGSSDLTDEQLARLPLEQFTSLSLTGTRVTAKGAEELRRCSQLKTVVLEGTQFNSTTADVLAELGTIESLGLLGPEVTDEDLEPLHRFSRLERLQLGNDRVTVKGRAALQAALPECRIWP